MAAEWHRGWARASHGWTEPGRPCGREEVILSERTLGLLDRNMNWFVERRDKLRQMQMGIKKGLLF
jgi:hypothetical protein